MGAVAHQDQARHSAGCRDGHLERHQRPERVPGQYEAVDPEVVERVEDVRPGCHHALVGHERRTVAGQVQGDRPDAGLGEQRKVCPPHGPIRGPGVEQDDGAPVARLVKGQQHGSAFRR